jgi:cyclophilin family peptidyl-prolyl cis-trans isomerase
VVIAPADAGLPPDYAVLGRVTDGMDVVNAIGKLGDAQEQPTQVVTIDKVTIEN